MHLAEPRGGESLRRYFYKNNATRLRLMDASYVAVGLNLKSNNVIFYYYSITGGNLISKKGCNISVKAYKIVALLTTMYNNHRERYSARCNRSHLRGESVTSRLINIVLYLRTMCPSVYSRFISLT